MLVGPPQVGKTTTKHRLLGDCDNLRKQQASTGLEAPIELTYLDSSAAALLSTDEDGSSVSTWSRLSIDKLALLFLHNIESQEMSTTTRVTNQPMATETRSRFAAFLDKLKSILPHKAQPTALEESAASIGAAVIEKDVSHNEADTFMKQIYERMSQHKEEISEHLSKATTVYLIDTGGQPEFHDLLPLLLRGPAFYLIFFSLADSLDDRYVIRCSYSPSSTSDKGCYKSAHSIKHVICQMLTSFAHSSVKKEDKCSIKPQAFVLATHLDKVSPEQVKAIDEELRKVLEFKNQSPQHEILVDATDRFGTLFVPIDNMSSSDQEVENLRSFLTDAVGKCCKPVPVPITWLMFHFILRDRYETKKVCTYEESVELATKCGINSRDVSDVLTYIYRKLGTILFYEDVPALNQLVICNPEVVYEAISSLIFDLYSSLERNDSARFTGLISDRVFRSHISSRFLKADYIIELLKHFRILSPIKPSSQSSAVQYFVPCILHSSDSEVISDPHPLVFCFPFTPNESDCEECHAIPIGLATGLIVHLHSLPPTDFEGRMVDKPWEFSDIQHYKNLYWFVVYDYSTVSVAIKGKHVEVHLISIDDDETRSGKVCVRVMQDVEAALVALCQLYEYNLTPQMRLFCSNRTCSIGPHLAEYLVNSRQLRCREVKCNKARYFPEKLQMKWVEVS